ncbi:MAG: zf-HC2 domain-containing protein [Candidatus Dormibacteraceae bacterium]
MSTPEPLTCEEFVELVTDYLEGALDASTRERFEHHMALCDGCEVYLDQIQETVRVVGSFSDENLSEPARSRLLAAFRTW